MQASWKKLLPHVAAYVLMALVSIVYFKPQAIDGKELPQSDNIQALGMQAEINKYKDEGEFPLWTNAMFSGMPTYQIAYRTSNLLKYVFKAMLWGNDMRPPHTAALVMMFGVYLLLVFLGVDWRVAMLGGIGYGLASNHAALFEAGHSTKILAAAYMAPVLGSIWLTLNGRYLLGGALTALFTGLQLYANHMQITFYFFFTVLFLLLFWAVGMIRARQWDRVWRAGGTLLIAVLLAAATNAGRLWTTWEYTQETIRGKSELTHKESSSGSVAGEDGLSKEYAFDWSYGILETFNLLIPNYMGGTSSEAFVSDPTSRTMQALRRLENMEQVQQFAQLTTHYWGDQPFTSAPVYLGIVFVLLFLLGALLVRGTLKKWLVFSTILTIMLAWGKNFPALNYFLFDYVPMFNKFRAVTMALELTNLYVVVLAALGLFAFFQKEHTREEKEKALYASGSIVAGLLLLGLIISFFLDYGTAGMPEPLASALAADRAALLRADVWRSFGFAAAAWAVLYFALRQNLRPIYTLVAVGLLAIADIWGVGRRVLSEADYVPRAQKARITQPTEADQLILRDPDPHFRVADFRGNPFNSALTSYHHKSIGGYHAAKLMRYQELIERYLSDPGKYLHIYGMLNARYIITQDGRVQRNPKALGNAWFVRHIQVVPTADDEFNALDTLDPRTTAVIQEKYAGKLAGWQPQYDSTATIELASYHPNELVYRYRARSDQFAVFSEVYYPPSKGWKVYLDGEPYEPFTKVDFLLRGLRLPKGEHELKMVFAPESYYKGERISLAGSALVLLWTTGALVQHFRHHPLPDPDRLPEPEAPRKAEATRRRRKSSKGKRKGK